MEEEQQSKMVNTEEVSLNVAPPTVATQEPLSSAALSSSSIIKTNVLISITVDASKASRLP